jgi:S1-C subfamily serine protease
MTRERNLRRVPSAVLTGLIGLLAVVVAPARAAGQAGVPGEVALAEEEAFRTAVAAVAGAVVRIEPGAAAATVNAGAEAAPSSGPSTGLVIDADGWVVTTAFAVPADVTETVVVFPDGSRGVGRVTGRDETRGIVLLRAAPLPAGIAPAAAWVPRGELAVGQWTIAVGRGWDATAPGVAVGILSALHRSWGRSVQTDAAVSPSNYGGPLIDIRGRVIGVLAPLPADTAGMNAGTELYDSGIGFAVPLEDILRVLPRLQAGETLRPGIIGIGYRSRDAVNATPVVAVCRAGSPAVRAGMRPGDRIVSANGRPVTRVADVRHVVAPLYAGDTVELGLERTVGDRPPQLLTVKVELTATLPPWRRTVLGIVPVRVAGGEGDAPANAADPAGVTVGWVWPDGPAAKAGVRPGDVVVAALAADADAGSEAQRIDAPAVLAGFVGGLEPGRRVVLTVRRDGAPVEVAVETGVVPAEPPTEVPAREGDPAAVRVVRLEAAELPEPVLAVVPDGDPKAPLGVLVWFDQPRGAVDGEAALRVWRAAAARHGVAVLVPSSADPQRWGREDIAAVSRGLEALRGKRALDPSRVALAGSGAGGAFAWLAAERLGPGVRGVALVGAVIPRQATIEPAEPGRSRAVLFGGTVPDPAVRDADRQRLATAGYPVGTLPVTDGVGPPAEMLCSWIEALGVL